jgi:hypothetical protein
MGNMIDKDVVLQIVNDGGPIGCILAALKPSAPTLDAALELPEIKALVQAARPFSQVTT